MLILAESAGIDRTPSTHGTHDIITPVLLAHLRCCCECIAWYDSLLCTVLHQHVGVFVAYFHWSTGTHTCCFVFWFVDEKCSWPTPLPAPPPLFVILRREADGR